MPCETEGGALPPFRTIARNGGSAPPSVSQGISHLVQDRGDLNLQRDDGNDADDCDEAENQTIFGQSLALFVDENVADRGCHAVLLALARVGRWWFAADRYRERGIVNRGCSAAGD